MTVFGAIKIYVGIGLDGSGNPLRPDFSSDSVLAPRFRRYVSTAPSDTSSKANQESRCDGAASESRQPVQCHGNLARADGVAKTSGVITSEVARNGHVSRTRLRIISATRATLSLSDETRES
jgi:hypothetical protein